MRVYGVKNKYWEERDKGTWDKSPNIFEDDCKPFY